MAKKPINIEAEKAIKQYMEIIKKLELLHKPFCDCAVIFKEITYFMDHKINIIIKKDEQNIYKISYNKAKQEFTPELPINITNNFINIIYLLLNSNIKTYTFYYDRYEN